MYVPCQIEHQLNPDITRKTATAAHTSRIVQGHVTDIPKCDFHRLSTANEHYHSLHL